MAALVGGIPVDANDWTWIIGRQVSINYIPPGPYSINLWNRQNLTPMQNLPRNNAPGGLPTGSGVNVCCFKKNGPADGTRPDMPIEHPEPDAEATCSEFLGEVPVATDPNLGEPWCEA